jgi:hypothetical protein
MQHLVDLQENEKYTFCCFFQFTDIYPDVRFFTLHLGSSRCVIFDLKKVAVDEALNCEASLRAISHVRCARWRHLKKLQTSFIGDLLGWNFFSPKFLYVSVSWQQEKAGAIEIAWNPEVPHYCAQVQLTYSVMAQNLFKNSGPLPGHAL